MKKVEKKNLLTALYCRLSVDDFDEKDKKKNNMWASTMLLT